MKNCKIGILHNQPIPPDHDFSEASIDIITQVEAVEGALAEIGCPFARVLFTSDLNSALCVLAEEKPDAVINLCESVDEDPHYCGHPAAVLELLHIPFSGSPSLSLMLTTDKLLSKHLLASAGIKTPAFCEYDEESPSAPDSLGYPVIVKPRFEDASIGIDQDSVFQSHSALRENLETMYERYGPLLIEEYIEGHEFNISLLGFPEPKVLPIAEIVFEEFPPELFRIVGYRAKWDTSSFEYHHSPRAFPKLPDTLRKRLEDVALQCFDLFSLRDYARVDVRVDSRGEIFVLEANANPCLSPDAGFAAAAEEYGMNYTQLIEYLLHCIQKRIYR
jgi:D-alanine-D-alanine ligase